MLWSEVTSILVVPVFLVCGFLVKNSQVSLEEVASLQGDPGLL